ncbi:MAG: molybdenum ABC transporter ATP-binding protein [Alphaproteobacteria bacterium]|nr:molybdenum ABC transporter ATP-binding protein [Alphaproteobacteria bacterium]
MLEVEIRKRRGDLRLDVAFSSPTPGVTCLFGASGAGKTTVIAALAGLLRPDAGRIVLAGRVLFDSAAGIALPPERRRLGYVFQDARLFPHLSVEANLRYGWRRVAGQERRIGFDEVVGLLGIASLMRHRPTHLSGGERQRVAIGRALLAQPRLLLMDEPLASLDADRKAELLRYLERLRDELRLPIVYVTHATAEMMRLADTLVLLEAGRVAATGALAEVTARPDLPRTLARQLAGSVWRATVVRHDEARRLSVLAAAGVELLTPRVAAAAGSALRLRIRARDVILGLERPQGLSLHNVLPATVAAIHAEADGMAQVQLAVGEGRLLALITTDAVARLALAPGRPVFALLKSMSVDLGEVLGEAE